MTDAPRRAATPSGGPRAPLAALALVAAIVVSACGNSTVAPTKGPAPTASLPGGLSSSPSPGPSASHRVDPAGAAMTAFVALVTKDDFSYQATFTGQDRHTTDIIPISHGLLQVSGKDVLVRATFAFPGERYVVEHRYVAGKGWVRFATTDTWHHLTMHPTDTMAAFAAIHTKTDLTYLGPVTSGGTTYYQVSFRSAIVNPVMIPAGNLTETVVTSPKLKILIDAAGRPVKGTAEIDGRGRVSGQLQEIIIDLTLTFTKVGQAVTIKAP